MVPDTAPQEHQRVSYHGKSVVNEQDVRQRMEGFVKMPRAAAIIVAALVGLACSSSGLKTIADAGAASGGHAGSATAAEPPEARVALLVQVELEVAA
jgi:hypothetical protein